MNDVQRAYGIQAERYIELFGATTQVDAHDLAFIVRHLSVVGGAVLDLGCGPGHLTEHLRGLGVDASGIDLVPEFIEHARVTHPCGRYDIGSMVGLSAADGSVDGILSWYSVIHLTPDDIDAVLAEFRRVVADFGTIVIGFFDGDEVAMFDHKVAAAWTWPPDELAARLHRAGFVEIARERRPAQGGHRPHAAIAAIAKPR